MNPSVYYAVLKHFGSEAIEQAILHYISENLDQNGYEVHYEECCECHDIYDLRFSNNRYCVSVHVEYDNQIIKLEAIAHVGCFSGNIQDDFFEKFPSIDKHKNSIFALNASGMDLLHIQNVIDLKHDGLFNFENRASEFIGFIDMISNEMMKNAVFLSFLKSDEIDSLKYGA